MDNPLKVCMKKSMRRNYLIKISIVGTISLAGFVLGIYSIINSAPVFALWYFVAFTLGLSYCVIRINTVFPTYVAINDTQLILSTWDNGIMPYKIPDKPNFISDFVPEKVKTNEIYTDDIAEVYIGSKKYLNRNLKPCDYPQIFEHLEKDKHYENMLRRMDFLYVLAKNGEHCFMSVTDFDIDGLADLVDTIEKNCMGVQIHINLPKLARLRERINRT